VLQPYPLYRQLKLGDRFTPPLIYYSRTYHYTVLFDDMFAPTKNPRPPFKPTQRKMSTVSPDPTGSDDPILSGDSQLYYVPGKWYSFTICPHGQEETNSNRWEIVTNRIYECVLSSLASCSHYRYNVEISEPHDRIEYLRMPRIHAHGRFRMPTEECVRKFLLFGLYNLTQLGIIKIDTVSELGEWDSYCKKQVSITRFKTVKNLMLTETKMRPFNEPKHPVKANTWDTWKPQPADDPLSDSDA